ncbi:hypothetical protein G6F65_023180 [Rhizopus arrhizus]|nr:hypothetical protein G6F65_023180 [Rhizopus arrhizus]
MAVARGAPSAAVAVNSPPWKSATRSMTTRSASAWMARPSVTSSTWVRQPESVCSAPALMSTASTSAPSRA